MAIDSTLDFRVSLLPEACVVAALTPSVAGCGNSSTFTTAIDSFWDLPKRQVS